MCLLCRCPCQQTCRILPPTFLSWNGRLDIQPRVTIWLVCLYTQSAPVEQFHYLCKLVLVVILWFPPAAPSPSTTRLLHCQVTLKSGPERRSGSRPRGEKDGQRENLGDAGESRGLTCKMQTTPSPQPGF